MRKSGLLFVVSFIAFVVCAASLASVATDFGFPISDFGLTRNSEAAMLRSANPKSKIQNLKSGAPWINLRDGPELPTAYTGAAGLKQILEQNLALPLALASGDFDEDGVPDLISGYAGPSGGILTLHRGNLYSIYPNAQRAESTSQRVNESTSSLTH